MVLGRDLLRKDLSVEEVKNLLIQDESKEVFGMKPSMADLAMVTATGLFKWTRQYSGGTGVVVVVVVVLEVVVVEVVLVVAVLEVEVLVVAVMEAVVEVVVVAEVKLVEVLVVESQERDPDAPV